jgi:nicotinamidase/pyrazinamidase
MRSSDEALVVVDLQYDFMPGGALSVAGGDWIVSIASRVLQKFDLVVATQDWHPPDHGSFVANHPSRKVGDVVDLDGLEQILWPVHCVQGTRGAELVEQLDTLRVRRIFHKGTDPRIDSYSGFYDNAHRKATGLSDFLLAGGVKRVYLMGLATDYCVKYSALDARSPGFETIVIEDCCRGVNAQPEDSQRAIEEMKRFGVNIVRSHDI